MGWIFSGSVYANVSASFLHFISISCSFTFLLCNMARSNLSYTVHSQGDRFGGALDGAAKQFSGAYDSGMIPMEFVNSMRRQHKLILGIGHRVKSVCVCV